MPLTKSTTNKVIQNLETTLLSILLNQIAFLFATETSSVLCSTTTACFNSELHDITEMLMTFNGTFHQLQKKGAL